MTPESASTEVGQRGGPRAAPVASSTSRAVRFKRYITRDSVLAIIILSPSIIAVAVFIYGFMLWTGVVSFLNWNTPEADIQWLGVGNWERIFGLRRWAKDLRNMGVLTVLFLIQTMGIGFLLAAFLDQRIKMESMFRTIFVMPFAISAIVTGVVWRWLMSQRSGINLLFDMVGLDDFNPAWYADKDWGIAAISIAMAWQMTGFTMALYLAGIRGISNDLREAAQIDGAGTLATYRYVIVPMLRPVTMTAFIILFGLALRAFDIVAAISGSGAAYATDTFGYHNFQLAFQDSQFSRASVIAVVMILISGVVVVPYLWSLRTEV